MPNTEEEEFLLGVLPPPPPGSSSIYIRCINIGGMRLSLLLIQEWRVVTKKVWSYFCHISMRAVALNNIQSGKSGRFSGRTIDRNSHVIVWELNSHVIYMGIEFPRTILGNCILFIILRPDWTCPECKYPNLTCLDLIFPSMIWPDLTSLDLIYPNFTYPDLIRPDLTFPDFTCSDLTFLDLTCHDLTFPDLSWPDLT